MRARVLPREAVIQARPARYRTFGPSGAGNAGHEQALSQPAEHRILRLDRRRPSACPCDWAKKMISGDWSHPEKGRTRCGALLIPAAVLIVRLLFGILFESNKVGGSVLKLNALSRGALCHSCVQIEAASQMIADSMCLCPRRQKSRRGPGSTVFGRMR